MAKTLLEKARQSRNRKPHPARTKPVPQQHIDLALAWLKNEVSTADVCFALTGRGTGSGTVFYTIARSLKAAYEIGTLGQPARSTRPKRGPRR